MDSNARFIALVQAITDADAIAYIECCYYTSFKVGINCIHSGKTCLSRMGTLQAKLPKAGIGVHKWSRNYPVLKALNIKKIETTIDISSLNLERSILCNGSSSAAG